jgi:threonine 3-dehydrogenase
MTSQMRAAMKVRPEPGFEMVMIDIPPVGPRDVLIKVKATSICGTDLHIARWDAWAQGRVKPPIIQGHELCGDIVEAGSNVTEVKVGDFVSAESHIVCNVCDLCKTGNGHICRNTKIIGVDTNGSFAEYIALPVENAWKNPDGMPVEIAVLMENFGNAVHTAFAADIRSKKILVTGCGPVGCMTVAVCKAIGARAVYATDISKYRIDLARKMGADQVFLAGQDDLISGVRDATQGEGVDVLLEMSGAPSAIRDGYSLLKYGGQAVAFGLPSKPMEFDLSNLVIFKGITIYGVVGRRLWETWYQARGLLKSGAVDLRPIVTHKFSLDNAAQGFEVMASGESGKVVFYPQGVPAETTTPNPRVGEL